MCNNLISPSKARRWEQPTETDREIKARQETYDERYSETSMSIIYEKRCPHCQGDILFAIRLEGPTLKCMQCTRLIDRHQARELLTRMEQPAA